MENEEIKTINNLFKKYSKTITNLSARLKNSLQREKELRAEKENTIIPKDMGRGMLEWQLEKNIQQVKKNLKDKKEGTEKKKMQNIKTENLPVEKK